jgi:cephalosporin-C deacetylase
VNQRPFAPLPIPPLDLEPFWIRRYERASRVDTRPRIVSTTELPDGIRRLRVEYTSTDDVTMGAWITLPADGIVDRGIVRLCGYGGTAETDVVHPALARTAVIWPCLRGLGELSRSARFPDTADEHVLVGIESRDEYIHGGCVDDTWCAITALRGLVPGAAARTDLIGGSFGGGIGIMATAWDPRIVSAVVDVPSFGNHPVRVTIECEGSGEAVRRRWLADPSVLDVLAYYDSANCAQFVDVPVLVAPALRDPAVPPPGQWSVYDALPGRRELFTLTAGHVAYPEEAAEHATLDAATLRFLADPRGGAQASC